MPDKVLPFPSDILAMLKRSSKEPSNKTDYYIVIGAFVAICVAAIIYVLLNPKKSFSQMQVIDESSILVHNGQSYQFRQGPNEFFKVLLFSIIDLGLDSA